MTAFKAHKVVAQLPATPEPNSVYYVRSGLGVKQFVTDSAGNAFPLMVSDEIYLSFRSQVQGLYWRGPHIYYGMNYERWDYSFGTWPSPNFNTFVHGLKLTKDTIIRGLSYSINSTRSDTTGPIELAVGTAGPSGSETLQLHQFDGDGQDAVMGSFDVNHTLTEDKTLMLFNRYTGTFISGTYLQGALTVKLERPVLL